MNPNIYTTAVNFHSFPVKTIFDCDIVGGCRAVALSHDARYLATLSAAETQVRALTSRMGFSISCNCVEFILKIN